MDTVLPTFADYHRTVIGFHGTRLSVARRLVLRESDWQPSVNDHDWLGEGIYFWEYAPAQAWWWANRLKQRALNSRDEKRKKEWSDDIAVVGAMIRLGNCVDMLEPQVARLMQSYHKQMAADVKATGGALRRNGQHRRYLDHDVFEYAFAAFQQQGREVSTSRGVYAPTDKTKRLWPGSWLAEGAHIQLCVRPQAASSCILGVWLAKPQEV